MSEPYSVASAQEKLDEFQKSLEMLVPNPSGYRLLDLNREYTPVELRDLLQRYTSYLGTLYPIRGRIRAEAILVSEGFKNGMSVARVQIKSSATTIADKEAEVLANNQDFRDLKKLQIYNKAYEALIDGWIDSYANAYAGVSRLISFVLGEVEHLSLRSN